MTRITVERFGDDPFAVTVNMPQPLEAEQLAMIEEEFEYLPLDIVKLEPQAIAARVLKTADLNEGPELLLIKLVVEAAQVWLVELEYRVWHDQATGHSTLIRWPIQGLAPYQRPRRLV